jgi:glucose/arabinose dehydrogenase
VPAFPELPELERPVDLVEVPGQGLMLVALQDGRILSFARDVSANATSVVLDQREKTSRDGNEEGLLGLALDPAFAENGFIYLYYSATPGPRRTVLARLSTSGSGASLRADPASELVILEVPQPYSNHKGGEVAFGPDGMLYLGLGDGGSGGDPQGNGQDLTRNFLGSILRLDVRGATADRPYRVPPDNPFAGRDDGSRGETWAYGFRNPWRFSFDEQGQLWAGDVGQGEWEEIDLVQGGRNYGWNIMEGNHCFRPQSGCPQEGLELPVAEYDHEGGQCSVTGGHVYRGAGVPALRGWYVFGDYCTGTVWAIPASSKGGAEPELVELRARGPNISSFAEDAAGELYILAFDGAIYRFVAAG